ncbi:hypothetical protein ETAA8_36700 [Anatilimnocola aggregata]|uniref:Uncharacterized protein n=1 Tax=Anatilimnocola aggregata TaxID=2528021 RepID=A0A517YEC1_9BACT|nr:hypothetical protein [Anatilimnocola aggregata]QDU28567.1 hypothetical protein ETAA8_36700 [Anatilimnocola aggregata]
MTLRLILLMIVLSLCFLCAVDNADAQEVHELSADQAAAINFAYGGGGFDYRQGDHCRAGFAQSVRAHAIPANTRYYGGYYVGGSVPLLGEGRHSDEGTFGWDYFGFFPKRVALNWTHGRRAQGGGGTYKTDGLKHGH